MTRAVPSLTRLSARSTVRVRRGSTAARVPTAVASVGATAAPSTQAGPHPSPSACAVAATAQAVRMTSAVLSSTITRRLLRISRSDVVRLSQYSSAGRNSNSTTSGGRCTPRSAGANPSSAPQASSNTGGATPKRRARTPHTSTVTPRATTSSRPSSVSLPASSRPLPSSPRRSAQPSPFADSRSGTIAHSCRIGFVTLAVTPIRGHGGAGDRREPRPGRSGCRRDPGSTFRSGPRARLPAPG